MEFILKLAYTLPRPGESFEDDISQADAPKKRKEIIQAEFSKRLGLKVDCPKHGYGNTNDGNTYRRFFEHDVVTSEITGCYP